MKNNKRLTRNSFKRKIIGFWSALLVSVALIATGFATWIISTNAQINANIGVSVGTVSISDMSITIDGVTEGVLNQNICFEPVEGDTGRVRWDSEEGGRESLTLILHGQITNAQHLSSLSVALDYSSTNLITASNLGYITLPTNFNSDNVVELELITGDSLTNSNGEYVSDNGYILHAVYDENGVPVTEGGAQVYTAEFICIITIGWGEYFDFVNPCYYYDGIDANGNKLADYDNIMLITPEQILAQLNAFKEVIDGGPNGNAGNLGITVSTMIK